MYETILVQELDLPPSGLARLEDYVPIPKFIPFQPVGLSSSLVSEHDSDNSYFHQCHFLAQIANRIILTRIRHSLYLFCKFKSSFFGEATGQFSNIENHSRVRKSAQPGSQRRTAQPGRAVAHEPALSHPILQFSQQRRSSLHSRAANYILFGGCNRRRNATSSIPDMQVPHWTAISVQSPTRTGITHRRRFRSDPQRTEIRHGLAHGPRRVSADEKLHSHKICILFTVSSCPFKLLFDRWEKKGECW